MSRRGLGSRLSLGFRDGGSHFRRHVFLIVLGQHLIGGEATTVGQGTVHHDALPFPEQIRQDARIE